MSKHTRNYNFFALALIVLAFLFVVIIPSIPIVKAQTQVSVYVYLPWGGTIAADGTSVAGGAVYNYTNGAAVTFDATASNGYKFLAWEYCTPSGGVAGAAISTDNPFIYTITPTACSIMAIFVPASSTLTSPSTTPTPSSKAQTHMSVYVYLPWGGTITANGNSVAGGAAYNYTIGTAVTFGSTASNGYKFLAWEYCTLLAPVTGAAVSTNNPLVYSITPTSCSLMAIFVPTSSTLTVTTPTPTTTINEFSSATVIILAMALVAVAFGTYAYTKRAKR